VFWKLFLFLEASPKNKELEPIGCNFPFVDGGTKEKKVVQLFLKSKFLETRFR
jgi:hypothetical protein